MLRCTALFFAAGALVLGQSPAVQGVFLQQAAEIARRVTDEAQARAEMQRNLGISAEGVSAIFAIGQEYSDAAENIEQTLQSGLKRRSPQKGAARFSADVLYENAWGQMDALARQKLTELKSRLSEEDYEGALRYMRESPNLSFFPYRATTPTTKPSLLESPAHYWLRLVRGPLSGPEGSRLFAQNYQDAELPPPNAPYPYLVGTVVAVEPGRVLLSMLNDGQADASLIFNGKDWKLNSEPALGTVVRFTGVVRDWTQDPILVKFTVDKVVGLDVETPYRLR